MLLQMGERLIPLRRNRDFVLFQTGQLLSPIGGSIATIAYPLLTLATTGSAAKAGLVGFAQFLPIVLFSLLAGVLADRRDRKRLMIASDVVRALAVGSLAAVILLDRLAFWHIVLVSFIEATGGVVFGAGRPGVFTSVVPDEQLAAAASAEQGRISIVAIAGRPQVARCSESAAPCRSSSMRCPMRPRRSRWS
jgi:MFS family permease